MKRLLFLFTLVNVTFYVSGQDYEPNTKWPYLYEQFQSGIIYLKNGHQTERNVNIHFAKSSLHYVENDLIQELTNVEDVDSIQINVISIIKQNEIVQQLRTAEIFVYIEGKIYKKLEQPDSANGLYLFSIGDFDDLQVTTGAYGVKNHTSAATKYLSLDLGGLSERNYFKLSSEKNEGQYFTVKKNYFFKINGELIKARKNDLEKSIQSPEIKERLKQYLKQNKVKWNQPDSLAALFWFLISSPVR